MHLLYSESALVSCGPLFVTQSAGSEGSILLSSMRVSIIFMKEMFRGEPEKSPFAATLSFVCHGLERDEWFTMAVWNNTYEQCCSPRRHLPQTGADCEGRE